MSEFNTTKELTEEMFDGVFGVCSECGRKRLGLYIAQYAECDECQKVMKQKYDPLYYFNDVGDYVRL
jgi:hypothetical protein